MKSLMLIAGVSLGLTLGIALGYKAALYNQMYFDAPAKIVIYSTVLENNNADEFLKGQIINQIRILNDPDVIKNKSETLLIIPPHGREFKESFDLNSSKYKSQSAYKNALKFMCDFNNEYKFLCQ